MFTWFFVLLILALFLFLLKAGANFSRGSLISFGLLGFCLIITSRFVIRVKLNKALQSGTLGGAPAVVIGDREILTGLTSVQLLQTFGFREVGRFELPSLADEKAPARGVTTPSNREQLAPNNAGRGVSCTAME